MAAISLGCDVDSRSGLRYGAKLSFVRGCGARVLALWDGMFRGALRVCKRYFSLGAKVRATLPIPERSSQPLDVIAIVRSEAAAITVRSAFPLAHVRVAGSADLEALAGSLEGVQRLLVVPPHSVAGDGGALTGHILNAAKHAAVTHLVLVSCWSVGHDHACSSSDLHSIESSAAELFPGRCVALRASFFMSNLLFHAIPIGMYGQLSWPYGDARFTMVAHRDVGRCAATLLAATSHPFFGTNDSSGERGVRVVHVTGPQAFTCAEIATLFSTVLGRPVEYTPTDVPFFKECMTVHSRQPQWEADLVEALIPLVIQGALSEPSIEYTELCGACSTLLEFIEEHRKVFDEAAATRDTK